MSPLEPAASPSARHRERYNSNQRAGHYAHQRPHELGAVLPSPSRSWSRIATFGLGNCEDFGFPRATESSWTASPQVPSRVRDPMFQTGREEEQLELKTRKTTVFGGWSRRARPQQVAGSRSRLGHAPGFQFLHRHGVQGSRRPARGSVPLRPDLPPVICPGQSFSDASIGEERTMAKARARKSTPISGCSSRSSRARRSRPRGEGGRAGASGHRHGGHLRGDFGRPRRSTSGRARRGRRHHRALSNFRAPTWRSSRGFSRS